MVDGSGRTRPCRAIAPASMRSARAAFTASRRAASRRHLALRQRAKASARWLGCDIEFVAGSATPMRGWHAMLTAFAVWSSGMWGRNQKPAAAGGRSGREFADDTRELSTARGMFSSAHELLQTVAGTATGSGEVSSKGQTQHSLPPNGARIRQRFSQMWDEPHHRPDAPNCTKSPLFTGILGPAFSGDQLTGSQAPRRRMMACANNQPDAERPGSRAGMHRRQRTQSILARRMAYRHYADRRHCELYQRARTNAGTASKCPPRRTW